MSVSSVTTNLGMVAGYVQRVNREPNSKNQLESNSKRAASKFTLKI